MANIRSAFVVDQDILPTSKETIIARSVYETDLSQPLLDSFLSSVSDRKIGLAPTYDDQQVLTSIALSSNNQVLVITFSTNARMLWGRELLTTKVLLNPSLTKYAFHMDKLCTSLFQDCSLRLNQAVDILSGLPQRRHLLLAKVLALGGPSKVNKDAVSELFCEEESSKTEPSVVALQAWAAYQAGLVQSESDNPTASPIDTSSFSLEELKFLAKTIRDAEKLRSLKPLIVKNEIEDDVFLHESNLTVQSSRYKARIMKLGSNQPKFDGQLRKLEGRVAQLSVSGASQARRASINTICREDPTSAEALRTNILLKVIQNVDTFMTLPFVRGLWFSEGFIGEPSQRSFSRPVPVAFNDSPLNGSQRMAVKAILSGKSLRKLVLIHGPPGTGKTTVIAAAVISISASGDTERNVWLVAQSNVAVKNIAEKLGDVGFFDFKILVSKDSHFDRREHLYTKIKGNVIRSDDYTQSPVIASRQLLGARVILCTLSMLSNDRIAVYTRMVPPTVFIFDEASQIEVGNYIPLLHRYQKATRKLVFIGDDKQLPPYGQSDIEDLQSVFELPHLRSRALFLDTQYRMPAPIGNFISRKVYGNCLKTEHSATVDMCCRFVDVSHGQELLQGTSWINEEQAQIVVSLARKMEKSVGSKFRIITPYDAQRSLIEKSLKDEELDWKDKVFNVDSFQGNEEDYIIISLVRTKRLGFLKELRRVNVMLTRCKKGMIICTDREFLTGVASRSLVAGLAKSVGDSAWVHWKEVIQPDFAPFSATVPPLEYFFIFLFFWWSIMTSGNYPQ